MEQLVASTVGALSTRWKTASYVGHRLSTHWAFWSRSCGILSSDAWDISWRTVVDRGSRPQHLTDEIRRLYVL